MIGSDPLTVNGPGYPAAPADDLVIVLDAAGVPLPGQGGGPAEDLVILESPEVRQPLRELDVLRAWAALTLPGSPHGCCCGPAGAPCLRCRVEQLLARDFWK